MRRAIGASSFLWSSPFCDGELWLAQHVKELGFEVFEVCVEDPAIVSAAAVAEASEAAGIAVSVCGAFGPERDVSHEDAVVRGQAVAYLEYCIDLASRVGSPHVAGPMYAATGVTRLLTGGERKAQRLRAVEGLRRVAEMAGERGVRLAIEPLNRFETDLINTIEQGLELCDLVGLRNVGLLLDTFHMNIEERSLPAAVRAAGDRLFHFHASENDRGAPGSGHIGWLEVFDALDDIGYEGQIVIESFTPEIKEIARAVSLWRPVAESPDALASAGLAFLRAVDTRRDVTGSGPAE